MGIMTRQLGETYVITSDRLSHDTVTARPPKRLTDAYRVWTGSGWSTVMADAKIFNTMDTADEYVKANYAQVSA